MTQRWDLREWIKYCINQHDVVCNQKYDGDLPYSFHLKMVDKQYEKFKYLLPNSSPIRRNIKAGIYGHDLIEDARVTYNDIGNKTSNTVAEIIFCVTDTRGRTRMERHSDEYFAVLQENDEAIFVKLCDVISNVKFSLLTNSTMLNKYRDEYPNVKKKIYREQYKEMFVYLEKLLFTL